MFSGNNGNAQKITELPLPNIIVVIFFFMCVLLLLYGGYFSEVSLNEREKKG